MRSIRHPPDECCEGIHAGRSDRHRSGGLGLSWLGRAGQGSAVVRVLVNAPSVKEGGSLVVLEYLLESMARLRPDIDWALAAHRNVRFSRNPPENLVCVDIGDIDRSPFGAPRWYELGLPSVVVRRGVNVVFSMTNYLPIRRLPCPTVLLVQHA